MTTTDDRSKRKQRGTNAFAVHWDKLQRVAVVEETTPTSNNTSEWDREHRQSMQTVKWHKHNVQSMYSTQHKALAAVTDVIVLWADYDTSLYAV